MTTGEANEDDSDGEADDHEVCEWRLVVVLLDGGGACMGAADHITVRHRYQIPSNHYLANVTVPVRLLRYSQRFVT